MEPCQLLGGLPGVVLRHGLAFVAAFVFLVDDDETDIRKGGEQGGAGTDDHVNLPALRPLTLVVFLPGGQGGIHHRHPVSEPLVETQHGLVGEGDFRNQHHRLMPPLHHALDERHVDLRFSAPGDSLQEAGLPVSGVVFFKKIIHDPLLGRA